MNLEIENHLVVMVEDFGAFVREYDQQHEHDILLEFYLEKWVEVGDAIALAGGKFATYLQAVTVIMTVAHQDPAFFRARGEEPITLFLDLHYTPECISPYYWDRCKYARQLGPPPTR